MVVQPGNLAFDHSYVTSVLRSHPGRLAGCLLADPRPGGGGTTELERLVVEEGYRCAFGRACREMWLAPCCLSCLRVIWAV